MGRFPQCMVFWQYGLLRDFGLLLRVSHAPKKLAKGLGRRTNGKNCNENNDWNDDEHFAEPELKKSDYA